jgi:DNA polymerase-1
MLAWDTETGLIAPSKLAPELACITFSDGQNADIVHWADPGASRCARWLLEQETTTANGPYDLAVLWAAFPELRDLVWEALSAGRVHDVQTRQKLMDIGAGNYRRVFKRLPGDEKVSKFGYSLSDLHARYLGSRMEKDEWRLKYGELRNYPLDQWPEGAKRYATYDAVATSRVHSLQDHAAAETDKHNLWDEANQVRAHFALHLMACWGISTDLQQVEKIIAAIDAEMPGLIERLRSVDLVRDRGRKENVRNEKLAKQFMYAAVGDAGELTKTGYEKVKKGELKKDEALQAGYIKIDEEWCEISGYPALIDYYHFRQNQLLRAKLEHIRHAARYGLPVQTQFEVLMETGRTSSSENKLISNSMALQNPPRKGGMRECFIARPGCTLIAADYGQAELVSLAQVTYSAFGYSKMRDLLNAGRDIHVDFGSQVMAVRQGKPITYEEAWALHLAKDKEMKDMRQLAKAADFGFPGGLGWASFQSYARKAWGVELTGEESKQLKTDWLMHFEEMREYFQWMSEMMEAAGGRAAIQQFMSQRWRGKCYYTQGCNSMFQGLTADAAKAALFEVARRCYSVPSSALYGCRPVLFVHDEIIVEAPREQAAEAAVELERVMVEIYQRYTPDVLITADAHLMDRWSKDAEAVHDERGKLVPWQPPQDEDEHAEPELVAA